MAQLNDPTRVFNNPASFDVYVKPVAGDSAPEGGQVESASNADNGWQFAEQLRFVSSRYQAWPASSSARFDYVPVDGVIDPFELILFGFPLDDQVRVVMRPRTAGTSLAPDMSGPEPNGIVVFDGSLQRVSFRARGDNGRGEDEGGQLLAVDAPTMDNLRPEHLVRGCFVNGASDGTEPHLVDGLPCIFNAGGRPNCDSAGLVTADAGELTDISAYLFTGEGDPDATWWTLKDALAHLVACWLYGIADTFNGDAQGALTRSATLEPATHTALFGSAPDDDRWTGLDKLLPEVDVTGLGVYDAIERVCAAAGYRCAFALPMGKADAEGAIVDRLYRLRIWRAGAGPENTLRLVARERVDDAGTAAAELEANNLNQLSGLKDAAGVRNHVSVVGQTLIETTVGLKPLWLPSDVDNLGEATISQRQQENKGADTYHQKHVVGGAQFNQYGHVGRIWGLDETGAFAAAGLGYSTGDYAHAAGGFDWLAHWGIDGEDALTAARVANGVTDPIRSSRRVRRPLRLSDPDSVAIGQQFLIEVSEDSGNTWYELPAVAAKPLREGFFGIMLTADNLASVNATTYGEASEQRAAALPAESWWALFNDGSQLLRFRITCLVAADHAARFDAAIDAGSISRYPRAQRIETRITEVWQSPSSVFSAGSWARLDDGGVVASSAGADRTNNLKDLAERTRDERSQLRLSIAAEETLRVDPSMFVVGDKMTGVAGRNVDFEQFAADAGETAYPSVVGVTLIGYPENQQAVSIDIGDEAARRGVR